MKSQIDNSREEATGRGCWSGEDGLDSQIENTTEKVTRRAGWKRGRGLKSQIENQAEDGMGEQGGGGRWGWNRRLITQGRS